MVSLKSFKLIGGPDDCGHQDADTKTEIRALHDWRPAPEDATTTTSRRTIKIIKSRREYDTMAELHHSSDSAAASSPASGSSISIVVVKHDQQSNTTEAIATAPVDNSDVSTTCSLAESQSLDCSSDGGGGGGGGGGGSSGANLPAVMAASAQQQEHNDQGNKSKRNSLLGTFSSVKKAPSLPPSDTTESRLSVTTESDHFEIVWSALSYRIEPKWYKKFNYVDRLLSHFSGDQTVDAHSSATSTASSSANMNDDQHQMHKAASAAASQAATTSASSTGSATAPGHTSTNTVRSKLDPIEIFSDLNGTIKSGQMTAVLGPSGAGKTTLLNCLTGKLRTGVSGHINLKGANGKHLKMCTIPQKDHLLEQLTVEENLWFASKIKNPEYGFDHAKNIERVIDLLGLKRCRSAKIGKISGGQHKRVSIAQELLSNPDILVLDEPTSGLDSLTCFKTISMLRDLVELSANNDFMKPMAIIVTIHQPQPKVFNLFHHVYILANGGRVIYEGAPEESLELISRITSLRPIGSAAAAAAGAADCSSKQANAAAIAAAVVDPASFLIEIASEEYGVEVINTLSDYQREQFHETNNSRQARRHRHGRSVYNEFNREHTCDNCVINTDSAMGGGGQVNRSFAPDFEDASAQLASECRKSNGISSSVGQQQQHKHNKCKRRKSADHHNNNNNNNNLQQNHLNLNLHQKSSHSHVDFNQQQQQQQHRQQPKDPNLYLSEQLLYTRVPNHKGRFWNHTATLTHRTLLTIRRDPLLMTSRVLFHLMIPILMGHVYGKATGAANACPHYEPEIDITQIPSLVENKRIEFMLEELHMSIENVSMFFIIMYAFAAAVLALNALSFPLNMQVLLKETRNGWYSMSSYVLAKTLADLPLELTMPCMTMLLVYPLTGQPSSYLQWRMLTICLIMTLCSLIAQTQALILGALVMNSVQTAVFVSQASQLPWVILAGFTIRIKRLSEPLKLISLTSFYRLGCEAITLTRYGFGICPCDPQEITGEPVRLVGIPDQLRTVAQYWIDSIESSKAANNETTDTIGDSGESSSLMLATTTTIMPSSPNPKTDIFQHLANQLSYANSYGVNITSCDDVAPDRIRAINLGDNWLVARIWHLFIMLIIMKIILYYAVRFSIGIRL